VNRPDLETDGNVIRLPYEVSRRVFSRRPRKSKNGTPEERAAKASAPSAAVIKITCGSSGDVPEEIRIAQLREFGRLLAEIDPERLAGVLSYMRTVARPA
jgi:hypothetical protein